MAEVILFRPREAYSKHIGVDRSPLGLLYVAGPLLEEGFKVEIIDTGTAADWLPKLKNAVDSSTICAGMGVITGHQIKDALEFSRALKKIKPVPIIWGGIHPSLLPVQTIENKLIDIVVIGEGERKFLEVVKRIKNNEGLDGTSGIMFRQDGKIKSNLSPKQDYLDLNNLPLPAYELIDLPYYLSIPRGYFPGRKKILDLNTDRGCPYQCGFCYNIKFNNRRWRAMSAERVLAAIEQLRKKYNIDAINFVSDNFFVDKNRVYDICKGIIDRKINISWHTDIRVDTFLEYEDELIQLIKKSGCNALTFGIESGSNRILDLIKKDIRVGDVLKAHKRAKDFNFVTYYHFMLGFPEETPKDVRDTMKLIKALREDKNTTIYGPSIYVPYPQTPLYYRCLEMGFKAPDTLEGWTNYDWGKTSKLPWFNKGFRNYLSEAANASIGYNALANKKGLIAGLFKYYYGLRLTGLIRGIRLSNLDFTVFKLCFLLLKRWKALKGKIG